MLRRLLAAAAASALLAAGSAHAASLLVNGDFESFGDATKQYYGYSYGDGFGALPGWSFDYGNVDIVTSDTPWSPPYAGVGALDINGYTAGSIYQSFNTVIGRSYAVSYAFSRNAMNANNPARAKISVAGQEVDVTAPYDTNRFGTPYGIKWETSGFSFVATGATTTFRLSTTDPGSGGVFFDSVSVTGVPEPATWAMMIVGFGAAGALLRRSRRLQAI